MSLDEVLIDCQAMIEPQAQKHGITMNFYNLNEPSFVHADRTRVKQILLNLLSNAIKYNHAGGSVVVDCVVKSSERIRISVTDTGPGISPDKLVQLFQPFNRLGQENSGEEGTGIGLVMTRRLVELMGGVIGVQSTEGKGSVFWVELVRAGEPLLVDANDAEQEIPPSLAAHNAEIRTLLYVEDNPANLKLVEQLVARRPSMRLLAAGEATLGIKLAREQLPEVILMDINLPGISGLRALSILRDDPVTQNIPIVAISANAMPHDIRKGLEAGFFRYLTKPIKVDEFMIALDEALEYSKEQERITPRSLR
jgi:CheY-like chemotaxis protein/anti-sigma regulatory factor (Ser/Thr protein kinase)